MVLDRPLSGVPEAHESDAEKIRDKNFVFAGYTFKRFHPAEPGELAKSVGTVFDASQACSFQSFVFCLLRTVLSFFRAGHEARRTARRVAEDMASQPAAAGPLASSGTVVAASVGSQSALSVTVNHDDAADGGAGGQ